MLEVQKCTSSCNIRLAIIRLLKGKYTRRTKLQRTAPEVLVIYRFHVDDKMLVNASTNW